MIDIPKSKSNSKGINFPLIFLIFILLATIWLYWYNFYIERDNSIIESRISEKELEIEKIKKDKNIQVYALISENKKILDKLESYSQITVIMNHLTYIKDNYNLILEWFSYSNWVVNTKATTDSKRVWKAYSATAYFIDNYRKDKDALFGLPFISKITWHTQISFNLKLKVKDNLINNKN